MKQSLFLLILSLSVASAAKSVPVRVPGQYSSLESIDWKNATLPFFTSGGEVEKWIHFRQGTFVQKPKYGEETYTLKSVHLIGKPARYAVLEMSDFSCGANCTDWGQVQILELSDRKISVVQVLSYESRHGEGGSEFNPENGVLVIKETNYGKGAHCCPEYLDVLQYQWTGAKFQRVSKRTIPNPS